MPYTLMMVAREPQPGQCKTRLCPPLLPEESAEVYAAFLLDLMDRMALLCRRQGPGFQVGVAYSPEESRGYFAHHAPAGFVLMPQIGRDMGERLEGIARRCLRRGDQKVVIMSSDSPNLPAHLLTEAFDRLNEADAVLGPCEDGGYYLVGLRREAPDLFRHIAWSTEVVLAQTLERARVAGLSVALLDPWYDIDTAADLERLAGEMGNGSCECAKENRATAAALTRIIKAGRS